MRYRPQWYVALALDDNIQAAYRRGSSNRGRRGATIFPIAAGSAISGRGQHRRDDMTTSNSPERKLAQVAARTRHQSSPWLGDDRPSPLTAEANEDHPPPSQFPVAQNHAQRRADSERSARTGALRVVWTGGAQSRTLAEVLGDVTAHKADANVAGSCIDARAGLLVARHLSSFDLCNVAVPHGFSRDTTRSVVAAVGSGPHSHLAATIAHRIALELAVPARAVYGRRQGDERPQAQAVLSNIAAGLPDLGVETIEADNPAAMVGSLPAGTLLVVGAPGGSLFQRQFFGPGARIQAKAPNGTIVVKHARPRVYQIMQLPTAFGPHMRVADAARLAADQHIIIALDGQLLGIVYAQTLRQARPDHELQAVMEDPVFLNADEDLDYATELIAHRGSPIPVVNAQRRLIGTVAATDLNHVPL